MNSELPQRRSKGRGNLPIGNAVIEEFEVAFPEIADYLLGTSADGVLKAGSGRTLPQEKQRTGIIIVCRMLGALEFELCMRPRG